MTHRKYWSRLVVLALVATLLVSVFRVQVEEGYLRCRI